MHIVHIVTRLIRGGSEENTVETCRWQRNAGHRVTLVHGEAFDPYWDAALPQGVTRIALPEMVHKLSLRADLRALKRLRALYRELDPDVIHTHQSKAGILGRIASDAVPGAAVVHGIHIVPFDGVSPAKRALYIAAEKRAAQVTDLFIAVSPAAGQAYVDAGITDRVSCVRSGIDLGRFSAGRLPDDWRDLLRLGRFDPKPPIAVMMAAFEPRKRHVPFLQAFAAAGGARSGLRVILAGQGPEEGAVRHAVQQLSLQDCVHFAGHRSDPEALFALADLSVLVSKREGLPRVAVQSITAGCPLLACRLPGLEDVSIDGRNSEHFALNDIDGLVRRMGALVTNRTALDRLSAGARATDVSDWSLREMGRRTTALYPVGHLEQVAA